MADPANGSVQVRTNFCDNKEWVRGVKTADLLLSDGPNLIGWGTRLATAKGANKASVQHLQKNRIVKQGRAKTKHEQELCIV